MNRYRTLIASFVFLVLAYSETTADCIEVVTDRAIVNKAPARNSLALGMARSQNIYVVRGRMRSMIKIDFKDRGGWIEKRDIRYVVCPDSLDTDPEPVIKDEDMHPVKSWVLRHKDLTAILIFGFIVIVIVTIIIFLDFKPRKQGESKFLLIVGDPSKPVQDKGTGTFIPLAQHCTRAGFMFTDVHSVERVRRHLTYYVPDIIMVDWNQAPDVLQSIESLLLEITSSDGVLVVGYNVPGEVMAHLGSRLSHFQFFTSSFTTRELDLAINKFLATRGQRDSIRIHRTSQEIALKGEISEGSISDILQMVEMGGKKGILHVSDGQPLGTIGFDGGLIQFASTRTAKERDAVYEMLDLADGTFQFESDIAPKQRNCMIATMEILMTWAQKKDEAHRQA